MFHTPNIDITSLQSKSLDIPLIKKMTKGKKETELKDLENAIKEAKKKYGIEGIVTGAVESVYQGTRIQKICDKLKLWCFNPLWQFNQIDLLNELIKNKYEIIISSIAAYPLNESWLGRKIDKKTILELKNLQEKYGINPAGEGGEFESLVINCPKFNKKIKIKRSEIKYKNNAGRYNILEANLK
tara:strand:- start:344 stop:898 length:555 start_codon:yes stop_codon:yes gene_type:complete